MQLNRPDDFHLHLRDGDALKLTVPHAAKQFHRVTVMPNLTPAVDSVDAALAYRDRILKHVPTNATFEPIITLYLTANVTPDEIHKAHAAGIRAIKLYPQGVTTNSAQGVNDISVFDEQFKAMAELGILLLIHGEVPTPEIDIFEREKTFLERILKDLVKRHPSLRIVMEHITTKIAAEFIATAPDNIGATITPQHLLANRNHLLSGGIKPHYYCLPILKTEDDRRALLKVATSGSHKFFLGTDSAPHATHTKENACGCAGCYSAPFAIEYYAEAFASVDKLDKLNDFASKFGADFYGLSRNTDTLELAKKPQIIPASFPYLDETITPLMAGETLSHTLMVP